MRFSSFEKEITEDKVRFWNHLEKSEIRISKPLAQTDLDIMNEQLLSRTPIIGTGLCKWLSRQGGPKQYRMTEIQEYEDGFEKGIRR